MYKTIILFCSLAISITATAQSKTTTGITGVLGAFPDAVTYLLTQVQQKKDTIIQQVHFTKGLLSGKQVLQQAIRQLANGTIMVKGSEINQITALPQRMIIPYILLPVHFK